MRRSRFALVPAALALVVGGYLPTLPAASASPPKDDTPTLLTPKGEQDNESEGRDFNRLRDAFFSSRLLSGDKQLTLSDAAALRSAAGDNAKGVPDATAKGAARGGTWTSQGPDPLVQVARTTNSLAAMSGRISALAIRGNGTIILGAAQGGVWTYDQSVGTWTSRTSDTNTQSVGALALAPSNDNIVYLGTGEAALSGDSYYGTGIFRSTNGGVSWTHVSTRFTGQSTSSIVVDPTNPDHLYAATVVGVGGIHNTVGPTNTPYGVYESTDGGRNWALRKGTTSLFHGATDLVMDPRDPSKLWASFWGDGIYKSADGGRTWVSALGNLPAGQFLQAGTRFSLGISHPVGKPATLYTGFDYFDMASTYHPSVIFRSIDGGSTWAGASGAPATGPDSVVGYCGGQCFYDNVVKPDPTNPDIVYALGQYGYANSPQSGGIYRSTDGGAHWLSLGYDLHPDYHAIAIQASDPTHIAIGNDGGVWQSANRGGRHLVGAPLSDAKWQDLNGTVDPTTAALIHSTGLAITQFTSAATVPLIPGQYWGGTQDNGTLRKSVTNSRWFDQAGGDGGQVIVDQTTPNTLNPAVPAWVFGSYYNISPYRYDPSKTNAFFGNQSIDGGIDKTDRSEFYVPWTQNRANPNQMFLGTYRLYRTNNAEAPSSGDVHWDVISGDLTKGCTGAAPNGAAGCLISAVGVADGGDGAWVGTDDGVITVSPDAVTAVTPTWKRVGASVLPNRPVDQIAVDKSNWRIAYLGYGGFSPATPNRVGHVYSTTDGGKTFTDVSGNLPDVPVNTLVIDPSNSRILYVGTDVGTFVSTNAGFSYQRLGAGIPQAATWQLDYDATNGVLLAGTHGRGAYTLQNRDASPALVVSSTDAGLPVGPGSSITYTVTLKNIGNAAATGVSIRDQLPDGTFFSSANRSGSLRGSTVTWTGLSVPAGGSTQVTFRVQVKPSATRSAIVNDGIVVTSAQGVGTTGSPHTTVISPPHAIAVAPAQQSGGAKVGASVSYLTTVKNLGYQADTFALTSSSTWPVTIYDASCVTPTTTTARIAPGASATICAKVAVPATAGDDQRSTSTLTVTSTATPSVTGTASFTSIAVASDTLLVDGDGNIPDVSARYQGAVGARAHGYWDLAADAALPQSYLTAHKNVIWWTGNSFPGPVTPYESELKVLLDGGGRLMMSGQDILDQAAGTTSFVHDYLHVAWDGSETQNDKPTASVTGVAGNPVTNALSGAIDHTVLNATFEDRITPIDPATAAFTDDSGASDALTVATNGYKVFFLAFPVEAYGSDSQRADLVGSALTWFAQP